jgi:cytochrome d ubiquinol oxidase subunit II
MTHMDIAKLLPLSPIPLFGIVMVVLAARDLRLNVHAPDWRPYLFSVGVFLSGYLGLAVSLFPNLVPFEVDIWQAAARDNALGLMLVGAAIMLPVILIYTGYVYSLFWGKVDPDEAYHD